MTNITSDEINYLIYRYLTESGFSHSSFSFANESGILKSDIKGSLVGPGSLIRLLQKGLLYMSLETHVSPEGNIIKCLAPFSLLGHHECQVYDEHFDELQESGHSIESLENIPFSPPSKNEPFSPALSQLGSNTAALLKSHLPMAHSADQIQDKDTMDTDVPAIVTPEEKGDWVSFYGHTAEVFTCAWNRNDEWIATGSGDGTARIWSVNDSSAAPIVLEHASDSETKDVTTLDWHPLGQVLATGSYDGIARIWTLQGKLKTVLKKHTGPIFAVKWNKKGDVLLTGSVDKTAIVWDPSSGEIRQQFEFHSAPCLDVDWRDDITFATCSNDKQIFVCQLGSLAPLQQFSGHKGEVNAIRWDPSGVYLASCSDDYTVKVWTMDSEEPKCDLTGHEKEIYTIRWNPPHSDKKLIAS